MRGIADIHIHTKSNICINSHLQFKHSRVRQKDCCEFKTSLDYMKENKQTNKKPCLKRLERESEKEKEHIIFFRAGMFNF